MHFTPQLRALVEERALACGFALCGIAAVPALGSEEDQKERAYFNDWIALGRGGEMEYLAKQDEQGTLLRSSLRVALPWAESVIVCAVDYAATAPLSIDPAPQDTAWIARYAWSGDATRSEDRGAPFIAPLSLAMSGTSSEARPPSAHENTNLPPTDYHDVILKNLRTLEAALHAQQGSEEKIQTRCYVDTGPIVERTFARYAGIGWVGKNTCLLNQQRGSWLFLGVIATSLKLPAELALAPAADRCGTCTRCIDACPTGALIAPRQMDASRCIAYLTIEKKGSIDESLRPLMGRQVFGCDICQDVCPWNQKHVIQREQNDFLNPVILRSEATKNLPKPEAPQISNANAPHAPAEMQPRAELINPSLQWLASLDGPAFNKLFRGSPLERTRLKRLRRNVAIAMANTGDASHLPQLHQWAQSEDETLRETANWAIAQLEAP